MSLNRTSAKLHDLLDCRLDASAFDGVCPPVVGGHVKAVYQDCPARLLFCTGEAFGAHHAVFSVLVFAFYPQEPTTSFTSDVTSNVMLDTVLSRVASQQAWATPLETA